MLRTILQKVLKCDMSYDCTNPVTHLGDKGWVYCAECAPSRRGYEHVRRLRKFEIDLLKQGKALPSYKPLSKSTTIAGALTLLLILAGLTATAATAESAFVAPASPIAPASRQFHMDKIQVGLLLTDAGFRALDVYSTRQMQLRGSHEALLPSAIGDHWQALAAYDGAVVAGNWLGSRWLVRHRHPRLAKALVLVDLAQVAPISLHNVSMFHYPKLGKGGRR